MKTPNLLRVVCLLLLVGLWVESGPRVLAQSTPKTPAQRFLRGQKGIIRDTQTKLQWFDGFEDNATSSWDYANDWANNLHVDGWGWSLANRAQLKELYSSGQFGRLLKSSSTWTSELKDEDTAWGFLIAEGSEELGQKSDDNSFTGRIAVRSSAKRFTKDSDGIITDSWTRLEWFDGYDGSTTYTNYQALKWAQSLTVGDGGWSLATRAQLKTLYPDAWPTGLFSSYYSHSSEIRDGSRVWGGNLKLGVDDCWANRGDIGKSTMVLAVRSKSKGILK